MTTQSVPTLPQIVAQMISEIETDVVRGIVPARVTSFAALHDYVDANEYGPDLLGTGIELDEACVLVNMASGIVDDFIHSGALRFGRTWRTVVRDSPALRPHPDVDMTLVVS